MLDYADTASYLLIFPGSKNLHRFKRGMPGKKQLQMQVRSTVCFHLSSYDYQGVQGQHIL